MTALPIAASCLRRSVRYSKWFLTLSSSSQHLFQNLWMTSATSALDRSLKTRFRISHVSCTFAVILILLNMVSGSVEPKISLIAFSSFAQCAAEVTPPTVPRAVYSAEGELTLAWSSKLLACMAHLSLSRYVTQFEPSRDSFSTCTGIRCLSLAMLVASLCYLCQLMLWCCFRV